MYIYQLSISTGCVVRTYTTYLELFDGIMVLFFLSKGRMYFVYISRFDCYFMCSVSDYIIFKYVSLIVSVFSFIFFYLYTKFSSFFFWEYFQMFIDKKRFRYSVVYQSKGWVISEGIFNL